MITMIVQFSGVFCYVLSSVFPPLLSDDLMPEQKGRGGGARCSKFPARIPDYALANENN